VDSAFAVPSRLADEQLAARLLSGVLGIPRKCFEARLRIVHSFVWIARKLPARQEGGRGGSELKRRLFPKENQRIYPKRDLARMCWVRRSR